MKATIERYTGFTRFYVKSFNKKIKKVEWSTSYREAKQFKDIGTAANFMYKHNISPKYFKGVAIVPQ